MAISTDLVIGADLPQFLSRCRRAVSGSVRLSHQCRHRTIHNRLEAASQSAANVNQSQDLAKVEIGLHDEIFHGSKPVLVSIDAASTYCYLLEAADHRDADTWGYHLLNAADQGLDPTHTIADAGQGLRAGQKEAFGDKPCHGDVFHIQRQFQTLANSLTRKATGAKSRRQELEAKMAEAKQQGQWHHLSVQLGRARRQEQQAVQLAQGHKDSDGVAQS